jgi:hypothetical protein
MIRPIILSAAGLASWAVAASAHAADSAATPDLRCLVVAATMASNANPQLKNAGTMASFFYLGKLDGHMSDAELEAGLKLEMTRMTPQEVQTEAVRCGQALQVRGKTLVDIGTRLQAAAPPKAP